MFDCIIERLQYNACTELQILCSVKSIKYLTNIIMGNEHWSLIQYFGTVYSKPDNKNVTHCVIEIIYWNNQLKHNY